MNSRLRLLVSAVVVFAVTALVSATGPLSDTFTNWLNHPAIRYKSPSRTDPVAELSRKMQEGSVRLTFDGPSGYLRSVLDALDVPIESQIAVFARDSVQAARIRRDNPRTLFFNDSVSVGWVRGGFIELATQDPEQGVTFYALNQTPDGQPHFV